MDTRTTRPLAAVLIHDQAVAETPQAAAPAAAAWAGEEPATSTVGRVPAAARSRKPGTLASQ